MRLEDMKDIFSYLNRENVSYKFCTEKWYMEIAIKLQDRSIQFLVEERTTEDMSREYDLRVVEPSGNTLIKSNISFDVLDDLSLIELIARYIEQIACFLHRDGKQLVLRETLVQGQKHSPVYYDSFLGHLHAAGFIHTNFVEHKNLLDETTIVVFVSMFDN